MDYNLIISPIAGGIIGGLANWIAIQMLFFPINKKKFLGLHIPFTPGIIPKERHRIARGIGDTISNYFLNEESIINAVFSEPSEKQLRLHIDNFIQNKADSNVTIGETLEIITGNKEQDIIKYLEQKISMLIQENDEIIRKNISDYINNQVNNLLNSNISDIKNNNIISLKDDIFDKLNLFLKSNKFKELLAKQISDKMADLQDKKIIEIMPSQAIGFAKDIVWNNKDKISNALTAYITSPSMQYKIKKTLKEQTQGSMKLTLVSKFIDTDKIFEEVFDKLTDTLNNSETQQQLINTIDDALDSFAQKTLGELDINSSSSSEIIKSLVEIIIKYAADYKLNINIENQKLIDLINKFDKKILQDREIVIKEFVNRAFNNEVLKKSFKKIIHDNIKYILGLKINKIVDLINENDIKSIQDIMINSTKKLITSKSINIFAIINISKIIEDKINSFETKDMVDIIYESIKKDVLIMRLFESLIGFIIGLVIAVFPYMQKLIGGLF